MTNDKSAALIELKDCYAKDHNGDPIVDMVKGHYLLKTFKDTLIAALTTDAKEEGEMVLQPFCAKCEQHIVNCKCKKWTPKYTPSQTQAVAEPIPMPHTKDEIIDALINNFVNVKLRGYGNKDEGMPLEEWHERYLKEEATIRATLFNATPPATDTTSE